MKNNVNIEYLILPFCFDKEQYALFGEQIRNSSGWEAVAWENKYFYRYISNVLFNEKTKKVSAFSFCSLPEDLTVQAFPKEQPPFQFVLKGMQIFLFRTGISFVIFEISFPDGSREDISDGLYHLKKVCETRISFDGGEKQSILALSETVLKGLSSGCNPGLEMVFHGPKNKERAWTMSYYEMEPGADCVKNLYFLKNAYSKSSRYSGTDYRALKENIPDLGTKTWGITYEGFACVAYRHEQDEAHLTGTFFYNFRTMYLMTVLLTCHEKLELLSVLSLISEDDARNKERLNEYQHRLATLEADYVYSAISSVSNYQLLYEKIREVNGIEALYKDIEEPLRKLNLIEKEEARKREEEERKRESDLNQFLGVITCLTLVSVWCDFGGLLHYFEEDLYPWSLGSLFYLVFEWILPGIITLRLVFYLRPLLKRLKRNKRGKSDERMGDNE